MFVTLEGIDRSGKTTQATLLAGALGPDTLLLREPGGTEVGERIRELLKDPATELDPRADRKALERLLDYAFGDPEPEDLERTNAVVIVQHGAIVAERYRRGIDPDRAFISWSMAKSITSCLVGILVKQGRLDISRPIPVKEWDAGDPRRRITIDQMLRMVDGLRFREAEHLGDGSIRYYPEEESDVIPMLFGAGKDDVAAFAATLPYQVEPEARWNYNSGASNLLSRLVRETIGGGEAEMRAFMQRELFDPLGMKSADPRFDKLMDALGISKYWAESGVLPDYKRKG